MSESDSKQINGSKHLHFEFSSPVQNYFIQNCTFQKHRLFFRFQFSFMEKGLWQIFTFENKIYGSDQPKILYGSFDIVLEIAH